MNNRLKPVVRTVAGMISAKKIIDDPTVTGYTNAVSPMDNNGSVMFEPIRVPMATPFDEASAGLCGTFDLPIIKIASSDIATWPLLEKIADQGYRKTLLENKNYLSGLNIFKGAVTYKGVADALKLQYMPAEKALLS